MSYVSSSPSASVSGDTVTWNMGTIDGGASRSVSITLMANPAITTEQVLTDIAVAIWQDELNNDYGPVSATAQTRICPYPVLSITINGPATGEPCDTLTFTLRVTNTSATILADNVTAQYILPSGSSYISSSGGGTYANGMVVWNLGTMAAGASREVTVTITYCVIPVGSEFISPASVAWQCPAGITFGPVFNTTRTIIVASPGPPPPPPPPTPPPAGGSRLPYIDSTGVLDGSSPAASRTQPACLPIYRVANLMVDSYGQAHKISVDVYNDGCGTGSYTAYLRINGKIENSTTVSVSANSPKHICWIVEKTKPGKYSVEVAGNKTVLTIPGSETGIILLTAFALVLFILMSVALIIIIRHRVGT